MLFCVVSSDDSSSSDASSWYEFVLHNSVRHNTKPWRGRDADIFNYTCESIV